MITETARLSRHLLMAGIVMGVLSLGAPAEALNGLSISVGVGDYADAQTIHAQIQKGWINKDLNPPDRLQLEVLLEAGLAYWRTLQNTSGAKNLFEVALTPIAQLQYRPFFQRPATVFFDLGIGLHLLSRTEFADRDFSTPYQFGPMAGIGFIIGQRPLLEFGYRIQHLSNAYMKRPNPGINFHTIRIGYKF